MFRRRRRHRHNASRDHLATARPRSKVCPVCLRGVRGGELRWCLPHSRWECDRHPGIGWGHCTLLERIARGWEKPESDDTAAAEPLAA